MAKAVLVLGNSGSGKSMSMRNMPAETTLVARCVRKPFPFRNPEGWVRHVQANPMAPVETLGNVFDLVENDNSLMDHLTWLIEKFAKWKAKEVLIIDDYQEVMQLENMRLLAADWSKYTSMAFKFWQLVQLVNSLPDNKRVYFMAHTEELDGVIRMKTVGKMINEKITPEGYFTYVVRSVKRDGKHLFLLKGSDIDTVKMPPDVFNGMAEMDNDLAQLDAGLANYSNDL